MLQWFTYQTAGLMPLILHYGLAVLLVALLMAAAVYSPIFKQLFLGGAVVGLIALLFSFGGLHDEANRCKAQSNVIYKQVDKAVTLAEHPKPRWLHKYRSTDRWDRHEY